MKTKYCDVCERELGYAERQFLIETRESDARCEACCRLTHFERELLRALHAIEGRLVGIA